MRTSAPGTVSPPLLFQGRNGFTLVELLIVLAIIGLMSAVVVLAMPDPRGSLVAEAERFAARAKAVQDRAVIDARGMAIRVTRAGYGFDVRDHGDWRPLDRKPFVDRAWGEGTEAAIGESMMRIAFDPTGIAEPAEVPLVRGEERLTVEIRHDGTIDVGR
ncbi:MAG TPA: prepilin-type N-terminal cleavage/methylation domain-containing protein [Allosphingosinicella sp.]|nr:prepilin-type N-terminal cleavage/methylation domain-containing protein [Allosphingosinicella sp.]